MAGRVVWAGTSSPGARVHGPSVRRVVVSRSGFQTRGRPAGLETIGDELVRVNVPRRVVRSLPAESATFSRRRYCTGLVFDVVLGRIS